MIKLEVENFVFNTINAAFLTHFRQIQCLECFLCHEVDVKYSLKLFLAGVAA
jgi:hypothetical protein